MDAPFYLKFFIQTGLYTKYYGRIVFHDASCHNNKVSLEMVKSISLIFWSFFFEKKYFRYLVKVAKSFVKLDDVKFLHCPPFAKI